VMCSCRSMGVCAYVGVNVMYVCAILSACEYTYVFVCVCMRVTQRLRCLCECEYTYVCVSGYVILCT
jgi:hypothetical protein